MMVNGYKTFKRSVATQKWIHTKSNSTKRVIIGMSGGVDSSVAAHLLKSKNFEVIGVFMKNWDLIDETGNCRADKEAEDAEYVCQRLQIPFYNFNFVKEYWMDVFERLVDEYNHGITPNPDIDCNKHIKFGNFYQKCLQQFGSDIAIATGHYARTSFGDFLQDYKPNCNAKLLLPVDLEKDQTLFLSQIPQNALRRTMFPLGHLPKIVVKEIATSIGLGKIAQKKESMGICFVGKRKVAGKRKTGFQEFLKEYIPAKPGPVVNIDNQKPIGEHQGVQFYTLGQRARIKSRRPDPGFVADKDIKTNTLYVCFGHDHPALMSQHFFTGQPYWIDQIPDALSNSRKDKTLICKYRSQNKRPLSDVSISYGLTSTTNWEFVNRATLTVSLAVPERAITPGQYAVFYQDEECLGSARIQRVKTLDNRTIE